MQIHRLESRNNHILSAVLQPNFINKTRLCYKQKTQTTKNLPCSCARGNVLYKCLIWKRSIVRCCDGLEKDAIQCFSILTTKLQLCWNQKWQFMPGAWLEYLSLLLSWPSARLSVMLISVVMRHISEHSIQLYLDLICPFPTITLLCIYSSDSLEKAIINEHVGLPTPAAQKSWDLV